MKAMNKNDNLYFLGWLDNGKGKNKVHDKSNDYIYAVVGESIDLKRTKKPKNFSVLRVDKTSIIDKTEESHLLTVAELIDSGDITVVAHCYFVNGAHIYTNRGFLEGDLNYMLDLDNSNIKYMFRLCALYVEEEFRHMGIGSSFVSYLINKFSDENIVIYTSAACSCEEYPQEPDDDEMYIVSNNLAYDFFEEQCGMLSINDYCEFESQHPLVYPTKEVLLNLVKFYRSR